MKLFNPFVMNIYHSASNCLECHIAIDRDVETYSKKQFGVLLCFSCQQKLRKYIRIYTTDETLNLYFALRKRSVPAKLEKFDGYKTIDIAVVDAKVNIEVDGPQHNFNSRQALSDLKRTLYSFKKGYLTLRIPNSLVRNNLDETADYIIDILNLNKDQKVI
jgi:very-short-patch-repair endonuclease